MLVYSISVSVDNFVADPAGALGWTGPSEEQFAFHLEQVGELGAYLLGRRLYETMLVWETDPSLRAGAAQAAFADAWCALPKVVFSRTLEAVQGNARLATAPLAEEVARVHAETDAEIAVGGADLAAQAVRLGLLDELRAFRLPFLLGAGTPWLPPVPEPVALELIETRTFGGGVVYERHALVRGRG